jgi:hypothetical protein
MTLTGSGNAFRRWLIVAAVCCATAKAQGQGTAPTSLEIRGTVIEAGLNQPIFEAEVTLEYYGQTNRVPHDPAEATFVTSTDAAGLFSFRPSEYGSYVIRAKKAGYAEIRAITGPTSQQNITLTGAQRERELRLALSRPGQLLGRVLDEGTRKPVSGVEVMALTVSQRGAVAVPSGPGAVTGADGSFTIGNLPVGNYVVEVRPAKALRGRVSPKTADVDLSVAEHDYDHVYWPGGRGLESAFPVRLSSGESRSLGAVSIRQTEYYRVQVRVVGPGCVPGDRLTISQYVRLMGMQQYSPLGEAPCGEDVLVSGFAPGAYRLMFVLQHAEGDAESASIPFTIRDQGLELTALLMRPELIDGIFVAAEGSRMPDLSKVSVSWESGGGKLNVFSPDPIRPDETGKFKIPTYMNEGRRLIVGPLGPGAYVKEIRFNRAPVSGDFVPLDWRSPSRSITIVVDDRPAVLSGQALKNGKPASQATVLCARWPIPDSDAVAGDLNYARVDENGAFLITGLAPGDYRLLAIPTESLIGDPPLDVIKRSIGAGLKVAIGRGAFVSVQAALSDLR